MTATHGASASPLRDRARRRRGGGHRARRSIGTAVALAVALVATVVLPAGISSTLAAWTDAEWANGAVGTATVDCGTDTGYSTAARSDFLRGALLGQNLDAAVGVVPLQLARSTTGPASVSPSTAVNVGANDGDPLRDTFARPLAVSALGGLAGLDLTGLQVGLPSTSVSALDQFTQVRTTGVSTAASGLVDDSGAVLVDENATDDDLPEPARLSLAGILPGIANVADAGLEVGAVGSRATLDQCAAAFSDTWGDGSDSGLERDYGVAGLGLRFTSPTVSALATQVSSTVATLNANVNSLVGTNGAISTALRQSLVNGLLSGLALGNMTGSVTITNLNLSGAVSTLLSQPISDGVVTIAPGTGLVTVDLAELLGDDASGLNDLDPNTELVLDSDVVNDLTARAGVLLDGWTSSVTSALRTAISDARIVIDLAAVVRLGLTNLVRVNLDLTSTIGELTTGAAKLTVDTEVLGLVSVLNGVLAPLGINVTTLVNSLVALGPTLLATVVSTVTGSLVTPLATAGATLAGLSAPVVNVLSLVVAALPTVLSLRVNVQPDQPNAPAGPALPGPTETSSGAYSVSALRIGLLAQTAPGGGLAFVEFATSTVGPNGSPPRV